MTFIRKYALLISLTLSCLLLLPPVIAVARDSQTMSYSLISESGDTSLKNAVSVSGMMLHQTRGPSFLQRFTWQPDQFSLKTEPLTAQKAARLSRQLSPHAYSGGLHDEQYHYQLGSFRDADRQTWMIIRRYPYSGGRSNLRVAYVPVNLEDSSQQALASGIWSPSYVLMGNYMRPLAWHQNALYGFVPATSSSSGSSSLFRVTHFQKEGSRSFETDDAQPLDGMDILTELPLDDERNLIALYLYQDNLILISTSGPFYDPAEKQIEVSRYSLEGTKLSTETITAEFSTIYDTGLQDNTLMIQTQGGALKSHLFELNEGVTYRGSVDLTARQLSSSFGLAAAGQMIGDLFYLVEALEYRPNLPDDETQTATEKQLSVSYPDGFSHTFTNWQQADAARLMPRSAIRLTVYDLNSQCLYEGFFDFGVNDDYLYRLHQDQLSYQQSEPERRYMQITISQVQPEP